MSSSDWLALPAADWLAIFRHGRGRESHDSADVPAADWLADVAADWLAIFRHGRGRESRGSVGVPTADWPRLVHSSGWPSAHSYIGLCRPAWH